MTGRYVLVYDPLLIPGAMNTIEPWRGYWVYAHEECELPLQPSSGIIPTATRSASEGAGVWAVRLMVQTRAGRAEAVFGVNRSTGDIAIGRPPDPPASSTTPKVLLVREGQLLAVDVRAESRISTPWEVEVHAPAESDDTAPSTGRAYIKRLAR